MGILSTTGGSWFSSPSRDTLFSGVGLKKVKLCSSWRFAVLDAIFEGSSAGGRRCRKVSFTEAPRVPPPGQKVLDQRRRAEDWSSAPPVSCDGVWGHVLATNVFFRRNMYDALLATYWRSTFQHTFNLMKLMTLCCWPLLRSCWSVLPCTVYLLYFLRPGT